MDGRTDGDDLIRIYALVRGLSGEFLGDFHDFRHTGHAADENEFVDLGGGEPGFLEAVPNGLFGALEEAVGELLQFGTGEGELNVFRAGGISGDERKVDVVGLAGGEGDLRFFRLFLDPLEGVGLAGEVDALILFELADDVFDEGVVPVIAAELGVAVGGEDFEDAVADFENGNIEGSTAEVINGDFLIGFFVETVGQRGGGRLVDDAEDLESGDLTGCLGGVALGIVEISGDRDHGLGDFLADLRFGIGFEFA